ncbi:hypothetical protein [Pseudomonas oryzihabitans]|uniref:hypothetical protein n=1 Tax=Pseudomonas oryzihabitans TaxID=47885 RepID=UPI00135EBA78|nr:hypothetical protein [Pseudomonas oryzihabitans]MXS21616.1 hypothetical protein [Pseudomonas oryzihabitans]
MSSISFENGAELTEGFSSMHQIGDSFLDSLPKHIAVLKIPGRWVTGDFRRASVPAYVENIPEIQQAMREVLCHEITQNAQACAEAAFSEFLKKTVADQGVLRFFNGWNETHKTTSLVSGKIIMRLAADALCITEENQSGYHNILAHMHEVTKDDFGLGQKGHDGMYGYMATAFHSSAWVEEKYKVKECDDFSSFLYNTGVAEHKAALDSPEHKQSILEAMMVSIASELWNGREYNYLAQFIESKLLSFNDSLRNDPKGLRNAKGYVFGHSGEVENRHGLHALAAAQAYGRTVGISFDVQRLKNMMLDYNRRVGSAFNALHKALVDG